MGTSEGRAADASRLATRPLALRTHLWICFAAAATLPFLLAGHGQARSAHPALLTGSLVMLLSVLNVELGRVAEGGMACSQRPHKALSAWSFASALVLPTAWLLPVVAVSYAHARWRGLRVPLWKWVGSAAYIALAGLAAATTARAVGGDDPNWMAGDGGRGVLAIGSAALVFVLVETLLFHGSAYLNEAEDEQWLRRALRSPSFYLTEASVLLIGGLSAALWTGGAWFLVLLVPVYGLAQRAALHEPLRELAERDGKTGLLRFEPWRRLALVASRRCTARQEPWSVLFADIDHFKRYNDLHGHLAGDDALAAVAGVMQRRLPPGALLGRFGGEEFCVLLSRCSEDEAAHAADGLRVAVEAMETSGSGITVSVGVVTVPPSIEEVELGQVLALADRALYDAKVGGRNQLRVRHLTVPSEVMTSTTRLEPTPA